MNMLLSLTDEEIGVLQDFHAEKIGHTEEGEADRAIKRIEQLERAKQSSHYLHDFEKVA